MDSIFSFKRFVKYLGYDIVNAKNYFGLSLLICGLMPAIVYLVFALFSLVFTGNVQGGGGFSQITSICISLVVVILCFPAKVYGSVTERRAGSSWTLLPASVFEKWLSMLVVCCMVLPLCFGVLFFGVDGIMSLIVKGYPSSAINFLIDFIGMRIENHNRNFAVFCLQTESDLTFLVSIEFILRILYCFESLLCLILYCRRCVGHNRCNSVFT